MKISQCKCGDFARVVTYDSNNGDGSVVYAVECNNPDCEEWYAEDFPDVEKTEEKAINSWNLWVFDK